MNLNQLAAQVNQLESNRNRLEQFLYSLEQRIQSAEKHSSGAENSTIVENELNKFRHLTDLIRDHIANVEQLLLDLRPRIHSLAAKGLAASFGSTAEWQVAIDIDQPLAVHPEPDAPLFYGNGNVVSDPEQRQYEHSAEQRQEFDLAAAGSQIEDEFFDHLNKQHQETHAYTQVASEPLLPINHTDPVTILFTPAIALSQLAIIFSHTVKIAHNLAESVIDRYLSQGTHNEIDLQVPSAPELPNTMLFPSNSDSSFEKPVYYQPSFHEKPNLNQETCNIHELMKAIIDSHDEFKQAKDAWDIIETAQHLDSQQVFFGSGEKLYAFTIAVDGQDMGRKSAQSPYYFRKDFLDTLKDHGLVDFENGTINRAAIADLLALPPGNKITCLVEAPADQAVFIETRIGGVNWQQPSSISAFQLVSQSGGGFQAHPETSAITRTDPSNLPIAILAGYKWDFRDFASAGVKLTDEQRDQLCMDYEDRRAALQIRADRIMAADLPGTDNQSGNETQPQNAELPKMWWQPKAVFNTVKTQSQVDELQVFIDRSNNLIEKECAEYKANIVQEAEKTGGYAELSIKGMVDSYRKGLEFTSREELAELQKLQESDRQAAFLKTIEKENRILSSKERELQKLGDAPEKMQLALQECQKTIEQIREKEILREIDKIRTQREFDRKR